MTESAFSLYRIITVTFTKGSRIILMAGEAETIFVLLEEKFYIGSMVDMTAGTTHFNWGMNIGSGKLLPIMTGKTDSRPGGLQ
mgnify:CR=1 FL=1